MGDVRATPSVFPGALSLAPALAELGVLRNGLGSIQNLELLLRSIKVGQKVLFAAVSAVHADAAPMIASVGALLDSLIARGADAGAVQEVADLVRTRLTELELVLGESVRLGRLSAAHRLTLEQHLSRCGRDLGAALPLAGLLDRSTRPAPSEPAPLSLVHASSAEAPEADAVPASLVLPADAAARFLNVDLAAARMLVALGVALASGGSLDRPVRIRFEAGRERPATRISPGVDPEGTPVRVAALRLVPPRRWLRARGSAAPRGRFRVQQGCAPGVHPLAAVVDESSCQKPSSDL